MIKNSKEIRPWRLCRYHKSSQRPKRRSHSLPPSIHQSMNHLLLSEQFRGVRLYTLSRHIDYNEEYNHLPPPMYFIKNACISPLIENRNLPREVVQCRVCLVSILLAPI